MNSVLVFDFDGVLVDVTESYREAIQQTVEWFTGHRPTRQLIQQFKNAGGWNNDWKLARRLIQDAGLDIPFDEVVARFDRLFLGDRGDGLILRERWVAQPGLLERLSNNYRLAIFTGRQRYELDATLNRLGLASLFDPLITHELVPNHKPAPDGLLMIAARCPGASLFYIGDTIDDARCARAAAIPFIGIAPPGSEEARLLQAESARAVLPDINQLETVL